MPQGKDALRQQAGAQTSGDNSYLPPVGYANATPQVSAPAGRDFGADLPVRNTGKSFTTNGYTPSSTNRPLPAGGSGRSGEGIAKPPTNERR